MYIFQLLRHSYIWMGKKKKKFLRINVTPTIDSDGDDGVLKAFTCLATNRQSFGFVIEAGKGWFARLCYYLNTFHYLAPLTFILYTLPTRAVGQHIHTGGTS